MQHMKSIVWGVSLLLTGHTWAGGWENKYPLCEDYYTKGSGLCGSQPSPAPVVPPLITTTRSPTLLLPPVQAQKDPIDVYLENYGKPPREFVAFYISPTVENAKKWASKYQDMIQKNKEIMSTWETVDPSGASSPTAMVPAVPVAPRPEVINPIEQESLSLSGYKENNNILAFSNTVELTYFFSANCPYCAQMTPDLAKLAAEMQGKLALTCVDVTPLSPDVSPKPENITGKLPCKWRLPNLGEVESKSIQQTPTLYIKQGNKPEKKLSGYVPLADLRSYVAK